MILPIDYRVFSTNNREADVINLPAVLRVLVIYASSKRSRFITLSQAATKSLTNFSCESSAA